VGKPNDLAACQVSPGSEWILAKVLQHDPTTGMYRLADEDVESNKGQCGAVRARPPCFFYACLLPLSAGSRWLTPALFILPPHPQVFNLPESQVVLCGVDKLSKGEAVFCVYPDTTSFYQATVVQAPRKNQANTGSGSFVMVNFVDDSDEFGVTHDKAVPLKHVIYPPYGATTK
jgi:SGF29 tudor-like domain